MNNKRRKAINDIRARMEALLEELEAIKGEEKAARDHLSPALQYSDKAERMAFTIGYLENTIQSLKESMDYLQKSKIDPLKPSKSPLEALY